MSTWGDITPKFQRLQRVCHILYPDTVGIVTAFAVRVDRQEYQVRWDLKEIDWYNQDELEAAAEPGPVGLWPGQERKDQNE